MPIQIRNAVQASKECEHQDQTVQAVSHTDQEILPCASGMVQEEIIMDFKYCIQCEKYCQTYGSVHEYHLKIYNSLHEPDEIDICDGPFAIDEPPIMTEEDWETTFANAPDPVELEMMEDGVEYEL